MGSRLRVIWILLQGAFLPLVYFSGKYDSVLLMVAYIALVYIDAILTCKLFEPKDKAK